MALQLVNRESELASLKNLADRPGAQLVMVWGRRRVGKTYLLQAFSEHRRCVFYTASQQSEAIELASFTDTIRESLGSEGLPTGYSLPNWDTALDIVTARAGGQPLIVILDEFPYLADSTPGLESIIQRWWDRRGRRSEVMLILCGSAVAYMRQIGGAAAPLHQRATGTIHLRPFDYRGAGLVVADLPPQQRAVVYGVLGGTPLYLEQWEAAETIRENLLRLFGNPASPLVDAAELVLTGELPEPEGHFRILQAVALGRTRAGEIGSYARVAVERPLKRLLTLEILQRRVPALDHPARTKRAIYRIRDPYFAFWFRFIASNRDKIARGLGPQLVDNVILPGLDDHMGPIFEEMARDHARALVAGGDLRADGVESWWSSDGAHEIDIVGLTGRDRIAFVGSVKWSARPLGQSALRNLTDHAHALPGYVEVVPHLLYGRAGCGERVSDRPEVRCFSIHDLYSTS